MLIGVMVTVIPAAAGTGRVRVGGGGVGEGDRSWRLEEIRRRKQQRTAGHYQL